MAQITDWPRYIKEAYPDAVEEIRAEEREKFLALIEEERKLWQGQANEVLDRLAARVTTGGKP